MVDIDIVEIEGEKKESWFRRKYNEFEPLNIKKHAGEYAYLLSLATAFIVGRCSVDTPEPRSLSGNAVEDIYPICNSGGTISLYQKIVNGNVRFYNVSFDENGAGVVQVLPLNLERRCVDIEIKSRTEIKKEKKKKKS